MKHVKIYKFILLTADSLLLPGLFFVWWISGVLLSHSRPCLWTKFGGQCVTCGGTHFVHTLLQGNFVAAFRHNPFLFVTTFLLLVSFILLHFTIFGKNKKAQKILLKLCSIPSLVLYCTFMMFFLLWRNWPVITYILEKFL